GRDRLDGHARHAGLPGEEVEGRLDDGLLGPFAARPPGSPASVRHRVLSTLRYTAVFSRRCSSDTAGGAGTAAARPGIHRSTTIAARNTTSAATEDAVCMAWTYAPSAAWTNTAPAPPIRSATPWAPSMDS